MTRRLWFWLFLLLALGMTILSTLVGQPLRTSAAPQGIVSLEFAGTLENAQLIIQSWNDQTQLVAAFSLGIDFLYPVLYALAVALGCLMASPYLPPPISGWGSWLARGALLAGGLDYIENISLWQLLLGTGDAFWAPLAWGCAAIKFSLVFLGILYTSAGGIGYLLRKNRKALESLE